MSGSELGLQWFHRHLTGCARISDLRSPRNLSNLNWRSIVQSVFQKHLRVGERFSPSLGVLQVHLLIDWLVILTFLKLTRLIMLLIQCIWNRFIKTQHELWLFLLFSVLGKAFVRTSWKVKAECLHIVTTHLEAGTTASTLIKQLKWNKRSYTQTLW